MPFRIIDPAPQFLIMAGTKVLAGGTLTFYQSGTSVLQDTYTDPTLITKNNNPLLIRADGRTSDIWGNGNYRVVAADSLGAVQWTRDNVQGPADLPTQAGKAGEFLTTDGADLSWASIVQVPDVTGQSGKMLINNGTDAYWSPQPAGTSLPTGGIVQTSTSFTIGKMLVKLGSGTATASGITFINASISFGVTFTSAPSVVVSPNGSGLNNAWTPVCGVSSITTTGCTATFNSNSAFPGDGNFTSDQSYSWIAIGIIP